MKITEDVVIKKELEVAPCLKCGHDDIIISDCNYSSFNTGGGTCKKCGHMVYNSVGCLPSISTLVNIWNQGNDIDSLIAQQQLIIESAQKEIKQLKELKKKRK